MLVQWIKDLFRRKTLQQISNVVKFTQFKSYPRHITSFSMLVIFIKLHVHAQGSKLGIKAGETEYSDRSLKILAPALVSQKNGPHISETSLFIEILFPKLIYLRPVTLALHRSELIFLLKTINSHKKHF